MPICNVVNTPVFLICVLLCAYIPAGVGWPLPAPCVFLLFGSICYVFMAGGNNICLCLHQSCAKPLFLWAYRQGASDTQSVAKGMYYIMAQFFAVWCNLKVDAQNTHPMQFIARYPLAYLKTSQVRPNLISLIFIIRLYISNMSLRREVRKLCFRITLRS